jgi:hypothetical protein
MLFFSDRSKIKKDDDDDQRRKQRGLHEEDHDEVRQEEEVEEPVPKTVEEGEGLDDDDDDLEVVRLSDLDDATRKRRREILSVLVEHDVVGKSAAKMAEARPRNLLTADRSEGVDENKDVSGT